MEKGSYEKRNQTDFEKSFKKNGQEKSTSTLIEPKWKFTSNYVIEPIDPHYYPYVIMPVENSTIQLPEVGKSGIKGFTERKFNNYLDKFFGSSLKVEDDLIIPLKNNSYSYEPDFALIYAKNNINIFLDIEVDEPYEGKNDLNNRKALHYKGIDSERDVSLSNSGWLTIRFAEIQIQQNPEACCKFIGEVLDQLNPKFNFKNVFKNIKNLENEERWSKLKAEAWSLKKYRENYLGIQSFGTWEDERDKIYKEEASIRNFEINDIFSQLVEFGIGVRKMPGYKTYDHKGREYNNLYIQIVVNGDKKDNLLPYLNHDILRRRHKAHFRGEEILNKIIESFADVLGLNGINPTLLREFIAKTFTRDNPVVMIEVVELICEFNYAHQMIYWFINDHKRIESQSGSYRNESYIKLYDSITEHS